MTAYKAPGETICIQPRVNHGGRFRQVKGSGEGAGVVIRDGGTPVQERKEQQKKREKDGSCPFAPFNHSYVFLY